MGQFAGHLTMVLAAEVDKRESDFVGERIVELSESLIGGRKTLEFAPELRLLGAVVYYVCTILSNGRTPGQQLCGLDMIVPLAAVGDTYSASPPTVRPSWLQTLKDHVVGASHASYGRPRWKTNATVALLLALFPYMRARLREGTALVEHMVQVLMAPEALALPQASRHPPSPPLSPPPPPPSPVPLSHSPPSSLASPSLARKLSAALRSTWQLTTHYYAQQSGSGGRLEGLLSFVSDAHFLAFLTSCGGNGFLHLAMRLAGVRLMVQQTRGPGQQRSLVVQPSVISLQWLTVARLTLLVAFSARVFAQQYTAANELVEVEEELDTSRSRIVIPGAIGCNDEADAAGLPSSRKCPLCMDFVTQPTTTPCGHVYCWSCLQGLCLQAGSANDSGARCPVCRARFRAQQARALFMFKL